MTGPRKTITMLETTFPDENVLGDGVNQVDGGDEGEHQDHMV